MAKKNKKRHSNSSMAEKNRLRAEAVADQKDRAKNRMDPLARNILLFDLVMLAACVLLEENSLITKEFSAVITLIGTALIPVALYFQFVKKGRGNSKPLK